MNLADPDCPSCPYADSNSDSNRNSAPGTLRRSLLPSPSGVLPCSDGNDEIDAELQQCLAMAGPGLRHQPPRKKTAQGKNSFLGEENTSPNLFRPE